MNPAFDVILDGLIKRIKETGDNQVNLSYVLGRIFDETNANEFFTVIEHPPITGEAATDETE